MKNRNFQKLWLAYAISKIGDWIYLIAVPLVIYNKSGSAFWMATTYAVSFLPYLLIMPLGGVIADLFDRKKILVYSDILSAIIAALICISLYNESFPIWILLIMIFGLGVLSCFSHPSFQSIIPEIVPQTKISKANSNITLTDSLLNLVAPALSGLLLAFFSPHTILWINAASFLLSAILVFKIKVISSSPLDKKINLPIIFSDLKDGFNIAMSNPIIKYGTFLFIIVNFSSHIIVGNLIYFLVEIVKVTPSTAGYIIGFTSIGAIIGAKIAPLLIGKVHDGRLMLACVGVSAIGTFFLLINDNYGEISFLIGRSLTLGAEACIVVTMFTARHKLIPSEFLGRSVSITRTISYFPVPFSPILGGFIISKFQNGMDYVILISAFSLVLCVLIGLFTPFIKDYSSYD